jgi:class 3 adenylate cyclase/tetratricopeptide (TPR) repeat protein
MGRDIEEWLEGLNLGQYAQVFAENHVDHALLLELSEDDLEALGITSLGHRKRLLKEIAALKSGASSESRRALAPPASASPYIAADAERRQLTVLFCDLVGSTELSHRLDPEDLRDVLRRYQDTVARAMTRYGGYVARYVGDGVLVYFGWPVAHEDQAERAIRGGLHAVKAVESLIFFGGLRLNARVGIATGQVVVGDIVGDAGRDSEAVTGETPNLAARLQSEAEPGQVVIDSGTRGLIGTAFELTDLGGRDLRGFSHPVPAWRVVGEGKAESRFAAAHAGHLTPFIGRQDELNLVRERWALAKGAEGQAVLLAGEAGIGKSRMVQALSDAIGDEHHISLRYQCSPYHTNSAFYPIIQRLERAAGFTTGDDTESRLDKLEALLEQYSNDIATDAHLYTELLSLPGEGRYGALELTPQQQRDRTIEALINQLIALSRQCPILMLLEDTHWIDPTTEALVGEVMKRIAKAPVLMVITYRPDYTPPWTGLPNLTMIALRRLSSSDGAQIIQSMGGDTLAAGVVSEIINRAGGVPLFVEELTKTLLESGDHTAEIPQSLQASLIARLDRLGEAGKVVPLAATLGRSFHYRLIRSVSTLGEAQLNWALAAMTAAGLLYRRGTPPEATYTFKHALIQDAAYETLLRSRRQQYHGRVAEVLLQHFPEQAAAEPELVARHLSLASLPEKAVEFWLLAGQRAGKRSAHLEAIAALEQGLQELEKIPQSRSRDDHEFNLCIALGASLLTVKGWSAPDVEATYERAHELSVTAGDVQKLFDALRGLTNVLFLKGEISHARLLADQQLAIAQRQNDKALLLGGYRSVGMCSFFVGEFEEAWENLQRANSIYDPSLHHAQAFVYGTDPGVICLSVGGWANWFLGDFAAARREVQAALSLAEEVRHPFSLAYARGLAASLYQVCRNPEAVGEHAEAAIAIAEEHHYPYWLGWATVMQGWAQSALGNPDRGIEVLRRGLATYESTGAQQIKPYILTLLAEMFGWAGLPEKGIETLTGAFGPGNKTDVCFYEAEALRIQGELLRQSHAGDGRAFFERALKLARRQRARALELRAAVSAGRAWRERGERNPARDLIADLYGSFDAGLSDPDLLDARELLATLGNAQK